MWGILRFNQRLATLKMFAMRVFLFSLLFAGLLFAEELPSEEWDGTTAENPPPELWVDAQVVALNLLPKKSIEDDGYTINYNTVSIVSDEPVTPANVMATLIQVLRIHGLLLLEQDNNLVIHKSANVSQIAKLVTKAEDEQNAPIVTRIFRVRNAKPSSIAAIIQPMISSSAILETSPETSQLILTDITANVDKIAMLIENLDSPHSFLEIQSFNVINNAPDFLIDLASQIMNPIAAGNPFILVPQPLANEIYVVSTPELVQKALVVLASLDTSPKMAPKPKTEVEGVYVYKVLHRPGEEILKGLMHIGENLQESAMADPELIHTIESAKWIRETNSIMLIGTQSSVEKTKEFLASLDVSEGAGEDYSSKTSFFIYKPQYKSADDRSEEHTSELQS